LRFVCVLVGGWVGKERSTGREPLDNPKWIRKQAEGTKENGSQITKRRLK